MGYSYSYLRTTLPYLRTTWSRKPDIPIVTIKDCRTYSYCTVPLLRVENSLQKVGQSSRCNQSRDLGSLYYEYKMQGLIERKRTNRRKGSATTVLVLVQYSYGPFGFSRPYYRYGTSRYEYEYGTWYRVYNFPCKEDESGPFGTAFGSEISGKSRSISVATTSVQYLVALYRDVQGRQGYQP